MGKIVKSVFGGGDEAKKAQQRAAAEAERQAQLLRNQQNIDQQNQAKQVVQVEAGGADMPDTLLDDLRRRKQKTTEMANQLGVV